jgi:hypothetical protein
MRLTYIHPHYARERGLFIRLRQGVRLSGADEMTAELFQILNL